MMVRTANSNMHLRIMFFCIAVLLISLSVYIPLYAKQREVIVGNVEGIISPPMANYVERVIKQAHSEEALALILRMDTPGGLDKSMRKIIRSILNSQVPVVVYVVPGGRATSAGMFIAMASHVVAMAPGTAIGAASPVGAGGDNIGGTLEKKVTNDAAEYMRGLAKLRTRNDEWAAEKAVREAESLDAEQALKRNVIDLISSDFRDLLIDLDGRKVQVNENIHVTLDLKGVQLVKADMNLVEKFLLVLSSPSLAYILLSLGSLGIFIELSNPGSIFPGVLGAIFLLMGFYGVGTMEANWVGLLLMGLAFALFVAELFVASGGVLGVGAIVSFVLGSLLLWSGSTSSGIDVDTRIIILTSAILSGLFFLVIQFVIRSQRMPSVSGDTDLLGKTAIVKTYLNPDGFVYVGDELWSAKLEGEDSVMEGERVKIKGVDGLVLKVVKTE